MFPVPRKDILVLRMTTSSPTPGTNFEYLVESSLRLNCTADLPRTRSECYADSQPTFRTPGVNTTKDLVKLNEHCTTACQIMLSGDGILRGCMAT
jgi:hypothetical protein